MFGIWQQAFRFLFAPYPLWTVDNMVNYNPRSNILQCQLNTRGFTASKVSVIEQLACKNIVQWQSATKVKERCKNWQRPQEKTSPCPGGQCVRYSAGKSWVGLLTRSCHDRVNWYRSLLTGHTVCRRATRLSRTQKQTKSNDKRPCTNSVVAAQDLWSYNKPWKTI